MYGHLSWVGWLIIFMLILLMSYNNLSGGEPYLGREEWLQSPPTWETINLCLYAVFLCSNFLTTREARDFIVRFFSKQIKHSSHSFTFNSSEDSAGNMTISSFSRRTKSALKIEREKGFMTLHKIKISKIFYF